MDRTEDSRRIWWPYSSIVLHAGLITSAAILILAGLSYLVGFESVGFEAMTRENGWLENTQMLQLLACCVVGSVAAYTARSPVWRYVAIAIVCVAAMGWAREVQSYHVDQTIDGLTLPRWMKRIITGTAALGLLIATITVVRSEGKLLIQYLNARFLWPVIPFISCFVIAELCEEQDLVFIEEAVEILAYSMMLVTCIWIWRRCPTPDVDHDKTA